MPMTLTPLTQQLAYWPDGTIRVGGTRLLLDLVIRLHRAGVGVEAIAADFPSVTPAAIHYAVAYDLTHRAEIDAYLAEQAEKAETHRIACEDTWKSSQSARKLGTT